MQLVYVKQEYAENENYKGQPTGRILFYNNGPITYQGIYKALLKIAVDMMPQEYIGHFAKTGMWVHGDFDAGNLPLFCYGEHTFFFEQPVLDLFFKTINRQLIHPIVQLFYISMSLSLSMSSLLIMWKEIKILLHQRFLNI